jgi:hypothetical protein
LELYRTLMMKTQETAKIPQILQFVVRSKEIE